MISYFNIFFSNSGLFYQSDFITEKKFYYQYATLFLSFDLWMDIQTLKFLINFIYFNFPMKWKP